jgi:two-component system chemotaxis response regulator CheY
MPEFAPRILLVDDDPVVVDALSHMLEANGFACRTAANGFEALKVLRLTPPDILISDLRMPRMSGFELLPIVRRRYPEVAIIVISSESMDSVQSMDVPMNAYLQKGPCVSKHLIATVRQVSYDVHLGKPSSIKDQCSGEDKG